jgi:hypothetical protein
MNDPNPSGITVKADPTPRRLKTAALAKREPQQHESRTETEKDPFVACAELRREMSGRTGPEPEVQLPWLNELDQVVRELNENVLALSCVDTSPALVFDIAASKVIENITGNESFGEIGEQMVQDGFDAVQRMMDEEKSLLTEQFRLLRVVQDALIEHRCDYRADLEMDELESESSGTVDRRPRTVLSGIQM